MTYEQLEKASKQISKDDVANAIFNLSDARDTLRAKEVNRKIDESDSTVGDLLDDVMLFLQQLEDNFIECEKEQGFDEIERLNNCDLIKE
jgi:hypothetical protein